MTAINNITYKQALLNAENFLKYTIHDNTRLECEILLAYTLKKSRTLLHTHPEYFLTIDELQHFQNYLKQRQQGIPIAYIIEHKEFWLLKFKVNNTTLIPRPETELLVELTLNKFKHLKNATILDLGTGCGAIAITLAHEKPNWQIIATDISYEALQIAQENAINLNCHNIRFIHSDWFAAIDPKQKFDAIISNPPYISPTDPHLNNGDLRFEPKIALVSQDNGLADLKYIIKNSLRNLHINGLLLIEHGYQQKNQISTIMTKYNYKNIKTYQDWQNNDRVSTGNYSNI